MTTPDVRFTEPTEGHKGFSLVGEDGEFWCLKCHGNAPDWVIEAVAELATSLAKAMKEDK